MTNTDYVIRSWSRAEGDRERVTFVDMHGRVASVVVSRDAAVHGHVDQIIRARVAQLAGTKIRTR